MTTPRPKYPDDDQPLTKGEARDSFLKVDEAISQIRDIMVQHFFAIENRMGNIATKDDLRAMKEEIVAALSNKSVSYR
jgi:soluble P-type ATPase